MSDQTREPLPADPGLPTADLDEPDYDDGVTHDPIAPDETGQTYMPPVDPPTGLDEKGDPTIAAGFGVDGDADPYDGDHRRTDAVVDEDMVDRIRERLAADSLGQEYAERLDIVAARGIVAVGGVVEDLDVQDHVLGLIAAMPGVREVRDRLLVE